MKRRRTAIVAFLLAAVMLMGIGYAAVSINLNINGTAGVGDAAVELAQEVIFTGTPTMTYSNTAYVPSDPAVNSASHDNLHTATYTIKEGLVQKGDTVTIVYTVKNNGDAIAYVTGVTTTPNNTTSTAITANATAGATTIAAGQTINVTVVVTLAADLTEATEIGFTTTIVVTDTNPNA